MSLKRFPIYYDDMQAHIELIEKRVFGHAAVITEYIHEKAEGMDPPLPVEALDLEEMLGKYHNRMTGIVVMSSMTKFADEMKTASSQKIQVAITEYLKLPTRLSGLMGNYQRGTKNVSFEGAQKDMVNARVEEIADYLIANDYDIPHLRRAGKTSAKVIACIAIIYTGHALKSEESKR